MEKIETEQEITDRLARELGRKPTDEEVEDTLWKQRKTHFDDYLARVDRLRDFCLAEVVKQGRTEFVDGLLWAYALMCGYVPGEDNLQEVTVSLVGYVND